jgi:hypothetical protein
MTKVLAALAIVLGGAESIFALLVAFGVNITPDQHTAIVAVGGVLLLVLGVWFHPDIPVGPTTKS